MDQLRHFIKVSTKSKLKRDKYTRNKKSRQCPYCQGSGDGPDYECRYCQGTGKDYDDEEED